MTEHNHRRDTKKRTLPKENRPVTAGNGDPRGWLIMHGKNTTGRDYSFAEASDWAPLSNKLITGKAIGNDFSNGRRGMAKAVRGAKKYVRSRLRFHENAETKKMAETTVDE